MPHTSGRRFRKCGEKPRTADQTPVLTFSDLRFCCKKSGCARRFSIFPRTSGKRGPVSRALATMAASATTSSSRGNVKGPLPKTRQRPFFVSTSRRIHSDCISEGMLQQHQHLRFSEMRPLFCKLIPNLEAIQLVIWQITVFL